MTGALHAGALAPFDVCGPLPEGVTVLEASAGTGKTFTIASLAARYVADGTPLERLLLVTFTRMATGELRDRVRRRLVGAEQALAVVLAGGATPRDDSVLQLLARGTAGEVRARRSRLATALAGFDAATIATTHEFCGHVLSGLGVAGDVDLDVAFTDDVRGLVDEVVDDLYVRKFHSRPERTLALAEARRIGHAAVANPDAHLEPLAAAPDTDAAMRRRLAEAVRREVEVRKRRAGLVTYDDLLSRLRDTLAHAERGPVACERLRRRYRVALVDEFQDTDPVQWEIMRAAFGGGDATLVLIGDPKQAIYAFRGADVYAYLDAADQARTRATLAVNRRSDQGLLDAYDALFAGSKLGHPGISYRQVRAAEENRQPRLAGAPESAPLRLRVLRRDRSGLKRTPKGYLNVQQAREHIARDLAADVVRLVSSGAEIVERAGTGEERGRRPLGPGDAAVLVRRHRDAALVHEALGRAGVPAVINGAGSVFGTPMAVEWLRLLEALERPTAAGPAHAAALTVFIGWTAERVATSGDEDWERVHARLHRWAGVLRRRGVASLLEVISRAEGVPRRVLSVVDGERRLTDLGHLAQLLHAAATSDQMGVTALTAWLRLRIAEADGDTGAEERSRRLESDAEAVQVLTIYRSKGLEFPVVYCPYLWDPAWIPDHEPPVFHDGEAGGRRIDVGGEGPAYARHRRHHLIEQRGEDLRLAYVALTRARHQAVVWWAPSWESRNSPLCRLLFFRDPEGNVDVEGGAPPDDDEAWARFAELAGRAPGCVSVEEAAGGDGLVWSPQPSVPQPLEVGRFRRTLDPRWRRTSYSDITAGGHEARVASEAEEAMVLDERSPLSPGPGPRLPAGPAGVPAAAEGEEARLRAERSLLADMPAGAEVGTLVHRVLEGCDFTARPLEPQLVAGLGREQARLQVDIGDHRVAAAGLAAAVETPLGPLLGDTRLRDVARTDRIDELSFELPLVGGDAPHAELAVRLIGDILTRHLPPGDALRDYAGQLGDPAIVHHLRGYLSGSIDLVLRIRDSSGAPRYAVVDYKTNRLGAYGEELSAWHYRPAALAAAMHRSHYGLQALLYTAALHRYLRWRLPGYSAELNLAGVAYLFLRGMSGAATPRVGGQPCGVFAWRPPAALVEDLSDLLDQGGAEP